MLCTYICVNSYNYRRGHTFEREWEVRNIGAGEVWEIETV